MGKTGPFYFIKFGTLLMRCFRCFNWDWTCRVLKLIGSIWPLCVKVPYNTYHHDPEIVRIVFLLLLAGLRVVVLVRLAINC